jgi:hypothetical protein
MGGGIGETNLNEPWLPMPTISASVVGPKSKEKDVRAPGVWREPVQFPAARGGTGPVREFCRRQVSELGSIVRWTNDLQLVPMICTLPWLSIFRISCGCLQYIPLPSGDTTNQDGTGQLTCETRQALAIPDLDVIVRDHTSHITPSSSVSSIYDL